MPETAPFASIDDFRRAHGKKPKANMTAARIRAGFDTEVKADAESRSLTFTISTPSVDRMGDTIAVDGWKLDAFRKNPVVLWAHDSSMLPVAKAPKVWIEDGKLKAAAEFTPPGLAKFNDTVFEMYKGGFLNATSVGFSPLKYAFTDDPQRRYGIDFIEQELLEFSAVPVPANAEALIEGKAAGIDVGPVLDWCVDVIERAADGERIMVLAEGLLSNGKSSAELQAFATKIAAASGNALVSRERIESIERAARAKRLAERRIRDMDMIRIRGR